MDSNTATSTGTADVVRYFAYGSNMDPGRLEQRVGKVVDFGVACLNDYCIRFAKKSLDKTSKLTIAARSASKVWGVAFGIQASQLDTLDKFEAANLGPDKPSHYRRELVQIKLDKETTLSDAITYIANPNFILEQPIAPSAEYLAYIFRGATTHSVPMAGIVDALSAVTIDKTRYLV